MSLPRLLTAALAVFLAARTAGAGDELLVVEREGSLLVFEARAQGSAAPGLVLPGRAASARDLELVRRWSRSESGRWSSAGVLPEGLQGLPFLHGHEPWLAQLTQRRGLGPSVELFPLRDYWAGDRQALVRDPRAVAVTLDSPDGWSFRLTELLADGRLSVREHTSQGPRRDVEETAAWTADPGWPDGVRLAGAAGPAGSALVFARAPGGAVLAGRLDDAGWRELPPFERAPGRPAFGLHLGGAPALLTAGPEALELWRLAGIAWEPHGRLELAGAERGAWAAAAGRGPAQGLLFALRLHDGRLSAWRWQGGAWSEESVPGGESSSLVGPPPLEAAPAAQVRGPHRLLAAALLGAAGLLLVLLAAWWLRRRAAGLSARS